MRTRRFLEKPACTALAVPGVLPAFSGRREEWGRLVLSLFSCDLSGPGGPRARKPGLHPPLGGLQLQFFLRCALPGGLPAEQPGGHAVHRLRGVERASPRVQRYVSPRTRGAFCHASRRALASHPTWGLFKALGRILSVVVSASSPGQGGACLE